MKEKKEKYVGSEQWDSQHSTDKEKMEFCWLCAKHIMIIVALIQRLCDLHSSVESARYLVRSYEHNNIATTERRHFFTIDGTFFSIFIKMRDQQ